MASEDGQRAHFRCPLCAWTSSTWGTNGERSEAALDWHNHQGDHVPYPIIELVDAEEGQHG